MPGAGLVASAAADALVGVHHADALVIGGDGLLGAGVAAGGVLALASYPTFDLSTLYSNQANYDAVSEDPLKPLYNRAILGTYYP